MIPVSYQQDMLDQAHRHIWKSLFRLMKKALAPSFSQNVVTKALVFSGSRLELLELTMMLKIEKSSLSHLAQSSMLDQIGKNVEEKPRDSGVSVRADLISI